MVIYLTFSFHLYRLTHVSSFLFNFILIIISLVGVYQVKRAVFFSLTMALSICFLSNVEHMRRMQSHTLHESIQSLASIMP